MFRVPAEQVSDVTAPKSNRISEYNKCHDGVGRQTLAKGPGEEGMKGGRVQYGILPEMGSMEAEMRRGSGSGSGWAARQGLEVTETET